MNLCKMIGCVAIMVGFAAWGREPRSEIVQTVEATGSGDLSKVSNAGITEWFGKHKDLAYQVNDMCKPVRARAKSGWSDTTEGRLCNTARELDFFRSGPVKNSGQTYWPGK